MPFVLKKQKDQAHHVINMNEPVEENQSIDESSNLMLDYLSNTASYLLESLDKKLTSSEKSFQEDILNRDENPRKEKREELRNSYEQKRERIQRKWKRY